MSTQWSTHLFYLFLSKLKFFVCCRLTGPSLHQIWFELHSFWRWMTPWINLWAAVVLRSVEQHECSLLFLFYWKSQIPSAIVLALGHSVVCYEQCLVTFVRDAVAIPARSCGVWWKGLSRAWWLMWLSASCHGQDKYYSLLWGQLTV